MKKGFMFVLLLSIMGLFPCAVADAPTFLEARSGPGGAIVLQWNGSANVFILYKGEESTFEAAQEIARAASNSYTDYPGGNGRTFYYWVTSLTDSESPPSPPASAVCDAVAPSCSIASPADGAHITGALTVEGTSQDAETGVSQVEVAVNGMWYSVQGTSFWYLRVASPPQGEVVIACRAQDTAQNLSEPVEITVFLESSPPHVAAITPDAAEENTQVTARITGDHFVDCPQVLVGTHGCDTSFVSDTELRVGIPPLPAGVYDVTVINPDGQSDTLPSGFTVSASNTPPEIISITCIPQFIPNNGTSAVVITAQVNDAEGGVHVEIDLTPVGGSVVEMRDDGVYPDRKAGDAIYTRETVVDKTVAEGDYTLFVTATDDQGEEDTDSVVLHVVEDPPDHPPELLNYTVIPSSGTTTTVFAYTVTYRDVDNNAPSYVNITITGVGTFAMVETNPQDFNYMDGKAYSYTYSGLSAGTHSYTISTSDGTNPVSVGATGPVVSGTNTPPVLSAPAVSPSSGTQTTNFRYTVTYTDANNDDPTLITITITGIGTFAMVELNPSDQYFKDGKVYFYDYTAGLAVGTHSYTITASDGIDTVSLGGTGPTVTAGANTPPVLSQNAVSPSSGTQTTNFRYTVTYTDANNDDPTSLTLTITGVGTFAMTETDPQDQTYTNGKVYSYDYTAGLAVGTHSYTITASDGTDTVSLGGTGPTVTAGANTPPVLSQNSVTPSCGNTSTIFVYQVTYTDADNDDPISLTLTITGIGTFAMVEIDPQDQYFKDGKVYFYVYAGGFPLGTQSYVVAATDGIDTSSLGGTGPQIPVGDCAPTPPVSPVITLYPISGPVGIWVTVAGSGFAPNENNIAVTFAGNVVSLTPLGTTVSGSSPGTVRASATGSFSAKFRVPSSTVGLKSVDAHGDVTPASNVPDKAFNVICPPLPHHYPPPPSAQPPSDTIAPHSTITSPKSGAKLMGTYVVVKGTASDNKEVVKVEVSFDSGVTWHTAAGTETWTYRWRLPSDGIYTICSRATDDEGNVELVGDRVTVILDNTPPVVTLTTQFKVIENTGSFTIQGVASDNDLIKKIEITTDGGQTWHLVEGAGEFTYQWNTPDGMYTIQARAWDDLGHIGYSESVTITVDTIPPELYISTPDRSQVGPGTTFLITGTAYDANGIDYVEVAVGEEGSYLLAEGTEAWSYAWQAPTTPGEYTIYIRAWDKAGLSTFQTITLVVMQPSRGIRGLSRLAIIIIASMVGIIVLGIGLLVIYYFK